MSRKPDILRQRDLLCRTIRSYFHDHEFVEVQTPVRVQVPALEDYIDALPAGQSSWLRTSPELHMKRLVASGEERVFQLGPCFRQGEFGRRHREEFTLLEWYQAGVDYHDLIPFTFGLISASADALASSTPLGQAPEILTVAEAFAQFAPESVDEAIKEGQFEELLVAHVEPNLGQNTATFLADYPASQAALARLKQSDPTVAERWELYMQGVELANAYSELTDQEEQRKRFEQTASLRCKDGRDVYPLDEAFLQALDGMPPTAGCALGLERLHMVLGGYAEIADVLPFPDECRIQS